MTGSKSILVVAVVLVAVAVAWPAQAALIVARYEFENSGQLGYDSSGGANHGTVYGTVTQVAGHIPGSMAAQFTESTVARIVIPPLAGYTGLPSVSFAAWVKRDTSAGGWDGVISQDPGGCCNYRLLVAPGDYAYLNSGYHSDFTFPGTTFPRNQWYHVAMTVADNGAGARVTHFYFNGMEVSGSPDTRSPVQPDASGFKTYLGGGEGGTAHNLQGALDDVRVYQGALTAAEVAALGGPQWVVDSSGNWSTAANWSSGPPNTIGATANFYTAISQARTVTVDAAATVGTLNFDSPQAYTLAGSTLNLDVSSGSAAINVLAGSHQITASLASSDPLTIGVGSGASLTLGTLSAPGGVTKSGAGTLLATGAWSGNLIIVGGLFGGQTSITGGLDVQSAATISPGTSAGQISVTGNYTQAGTLLAELAGLIPSSQYDRINVSGTATLGGTVDVNLLGGFQPVLGDTFDLIVANSGITNADLSGVMFDFSDATLLVPALRWEPSIVSLGGNIEALRLTVGVPEPSAFTLLSFGLAAAALVLARRQ